MRPSFTHPSSTHSSSLSRRGTRADSRRRRQLASAHVLRRSLPETKPILECLENRQMLAAGLLGTYFNNRQLGGGGPPNATRLDPTVNLRLGAGAPGVTGIGADQFSVIWEGEFIAPVADNYTFGTFSDDGIRLWVGGQEVVNQWVERGVAVTPIWDNITGPRDTVGSPQVVIPMAAGQRLPVVLHYYENGGSADAVFGYQNSTTVTTPRPADTTELEDAVTLPTAPTAGAATASGSAVNVTWADTSSNERQYLIQRLGGADWQTIATALPNATSAVVPLFEGEHTLRVVAETAAGQVASANMNVVVGASNGLMGQYFEDLDNNLTGDFPGTGARWMTRIDDGTQTDGGTHAGAVDFGWGEGAPPGFVTPFNDFSALWSGTIIPTETGTHLFYGHGDDGVMVFVNGMLVGSNPGLHGDQNGTAIPITLNAGVSYPIVMHFAENDGGATARLRWALPSDPATIAAVPTGVLTPVSLLPAAAVLSGTAGPTSVNLNFIENALNDYETLVQYSADGGNTWITTQKFLILENPNSQPTQRQAATITGLEVATQYRFRIISRNYAGDTISNVLILSTTNAPPGELLNTVTTAPATGDTNLTAEGNLDWAHWGFPDSAARVHRKHGVVGNRITGFFVIDGAPTGDAIVTATDTPGKTYSWTDDAFGDASAPGNPVLATSANSPATETAAMAIDNNVNTKYLNFDELNSGFRVQLTAAAPLNGLSFTSANDAPQRDPTSYRLEGSNDGTNFTDLASGPIPAFTARFQQQSVSFPTTAAFRFYRITFPTVAGPAATEMQIAEVEFLEPQENVPPPTGTTDAIKVSGVGNGFRVIVPARAGGNRRMSVLVGAEGNVTGTLTATMQDGSAAPVTRTLVNTAGTQAAVYTFEFRSGLPTSVVNLSWVATAGTGSIILSGVTWSEITPAAAATNLVATATGKGRVALTWTDNSFNETGGFRIERAPDVAGAPGTFATIATAAENINRFADANLPDNTRFHYRVVAVNALGDAAPTNVAAATTIAAPIRGLLAEYFNMSGPPADPSAIPGNTIVLTRFDDGTQTDGLVGLAGHQGPIHFSWDTGAPPGVAVNNFAAIWSGRLVPDFTGLYSFFTDTDDRGRLSIDLNQNGTFEANEIVINTWVDQGPGVRETSETLFPGGMTLTGGQQYNFKMEWYENGGGATAHVFWKSDFTGDQILPTYATLPPPGEAPQGAVTTPVATPLNSGRVMLEWGYNGPESTILFVVERAPDVGGQPGAFQTLTSGTARKFIDGTAAPETSYHYRITPATTGGFGTPVSATPSPVTTVAVPAVRGVHVTFYDNPNLTTPSTLNPTLGTPWSVADTVTSHPNIDHFWGAGSPTGAGTGFDPNVFAVRWRAKFKPEFSGDYTFYTEVDDGDRLTVAGSVLRDELDTRQAMTLSAPYVVTGLVAGQEYDLAMIMVEDGGDAGARLYWEHANIPREVVPMAVLTPVAPDLTPPTLTDIGVDGHISNAALYTPSQHLIIKFSEPVSGVDENDFQIFGDNIGLIGAEALDVAFDPASNTAILTFHDQGGGAVRHADGNYSLFLAQNASITDADGNPIDTDGDGQPGGTQVAVPYYFLTGDTQVAHNGSPLKDRKVSFVDYQVMSKNFGMTNPSHGDGDFNYDGVIDNADFLLLRDRFGTTLAPPPAAPVGSPVPVTPTPKPLAPKPKAVVVKSNTGSTPVAAAASAPALATTPAKPIPMAKPAPTKFATRKIGARDLLA